MFFVQLQYRDCIAMFVAALLSLPCMPRILLVWIAIEFVSSFLLFCEIDFCSFRYVACFCDRAFDFRMWSSLFADPSIRRGWVSGAQRVSRWRMPEHHRIVYLHQGEIREECTLQSLPSWLRMASIDKWLRR